MNGAFIAITEKGEVSRHQQPPTEMIAMGSTVIEISADVAVVTVRVHLIDESGDRCEEVT